MCDVLETLGYLADDDVTDLGRPLRRIYSELDLVVAEAIRTGVLDRLGPSGLAAALSTLVYEARRPDDVVSARIPGGDTRRAIDALEVLWRDLSEVERQHRLDFLRRPDSGSGLGGVPLVRGRRPRRGARRERPDRRVTSCAGSSS